MKEYNSTKIWAETIADISTDIDSLIEWLQKQLEEQKQVFADAEPNSSDSKWALESIEELQEKISAREWCLRTLNAPFKIKK